MIPVEFRFDPGTNIEAEIKFLSRCMPWLDFLLQKQTHYEIDSYYNGVTHEDIVKIKFYLPEKHETYYLMKYR